MADILKNEELSKDVENEEDEEEVDGAEEIETKDPAKKKKKKKKKKKTGQVIKLINSQVYYILLMNYLHFHV